MRMISLLDKIAVVVALGLVVLIVHMAMQTPHSPPPPIEVSHQPVVLHPIHSLKVITAALAAAIATFAVGYMNPLFMRAFPRSRDFCGIAREVTAFSLRRGLSLALLYRALISSCYIGVSLWFFGWQQLGMTYASLFIVGSIILAIQALFCRGLRFIFLTLEYLIVLGFAIHFATVVARAMT